MAEPDPEMEEMRLLSYETLPRACKTRYPVPRRHSYIDVMWCLDHLPGLPEKWCTAEVLHMSESPAQDVVATGVIRFLPEAAWDEEIHSVEFLTKQRLRRTVDDFGGEGGNIALENKNAITHWQCSHHRDIDSATGDDDEWNTDSGNGLQTKRRVVENKCAQEIELQSLRVGHAALVVEIEKMKKQLLKHSQWISRDVKARYKTGSCSSAGCVLNRLRHRVGVKMQGRLRTMSTCTGKRLRDDSEQTKEVRTGDGIHIGTLKTKVECTLGQFETLSARIKTLLNQKEVMFVPDFCHTQLPSPCSAAFSIMFTNLATVLSQIGVTSISDVLEIARKCGKGPHGDIIRVLGTYEYEKHNDNESAVINVRSSRGKRFHTNNADVDDEIAKTEKGYPSLVRETRKWDRVDQRFVHPLKARYGTAPALETSMDETKTFSLCWRRATELGPRTWSKAMARGAQVFGWLEINLPYIQVEGKRICEEVGGLLPDEMWQDMFST